MTKAELEIVSDDDLFAAEKRIEVAMLNVYYDIGIELKLIRDKRLYRHSYSSFKEYGRERWKWSVQHVYNLINAAELCESLLSIGVKLPLRLVHCRELLKLSPQDCQIEIWQKILANNGQLHVSHINAEDVKAAVKEELIKTGNYTKPKKYRYDRETELNKQVQRLEDMIKYFPTKTREPNQLISGRSPKCFQKEYYGCIRDCICEKSLKRKKRP